MNTFDEAMTAARILHPTVPVEIFEGLCHYVNWRVAPGSFLRAVLENNLVLAVSRAHPSSLVNLREIVTVCLSTLPMECWGNATKVEAWLAIAPRIRCETGFGKLSVNLGDIPPRSDKGDQR